jgi:hypothetical protein
VSKEDLQADLEHRLGDTSEPFALTFYLADGKTGRADIDTCTIKMVLADDPDGTPILDDVDCRVNGSGGTTDGLCELLVDSGALDQAALFALAATVAEPVDVLWQMTATLADASVKHSGVVRETIRGNL